MLYGAGTVGILGELKMSNDIEKDLEDNMKSIEEFPKRLDRNVIYESDWEILSLKS